VGTVDLTNYTGPLSIGSLTIGDTNYNAVGTGHFIFGNAVNNSLSFPNLTISNGDITVNSGATLSVANAFTLGSGYRTNTSGALNLSPGAAFYLGTANSPASLTVAQQGGDQFGEGTCTATFAPDSSANPNMALYISSLQIGVTGEFSNAVGTVDLTNYTGPLSIGSLTIGDTNYNAVGTGHFIFGNAVNNFLSVTTIGGGNGDLTINSGATIRVTGGMAIGSINSIGQLSLGANATLDLTDTTLLINYGSGPDPISTIRGYLMSGYAGGAWNGPGIDSSATAANSGYGLGVADSADPGNPADLSSDQIEIKYTLLGDLNLDGVVNGDDFTILVGNLGKSVSGWDQGDFFYTGTVNGDDFTALISNLGKSANGGDVQLPASVYAAVDAFAAAHGLMADVPEPASVGLAVLGIMGALSVRRRPTSRVGAFAYSSRGS
jgi:hypothetical protein